MASLTYIANPLKTAAIQAPAFVSKEISGLSTGKLEEIITIGVPMASQIAYPQYVGNISAFMFATSIQRKVTCGGTYLPQLRRELLLPLRFPALCIAPVKPFANEEARTNFSDAITLGKSAVTVGGRDAYVIPNASLADLSGLPPNNPTARCPKQSVNPKAFKAFATTLKIVTLFITTHSYAAFNSDEQTGVMNSNDMDYYLDSNHAARDDWRGVRTAYENRGYEYPADLPSAPDGISRHYGTRATYSGDGMVIVAKPAPLYPSINYGPVASVPNLPGFTFPYFDQMIMPSSSTVIRIFRQYFFSCFGSSVEQRATNFRSWENDVDYWASTKEGMVLSHIIFLIRTTLEAQARLYVVIGGDGYVGSCVLGYKFQILHMGKLKEASEATVVRRDVASLDKHARALGKIVDLLKGLELREGNEEEEDVDMEMEIRGYRHLQRLLLIREKPNEDELENLGSWVGDLAFGETYWKLSHTRIVQMLEMLFDKSIDLSVLPGYLDAATLYNTSREFQVLSAFGPDAPSFLDAQGTFRAIPKGLSAPDPLSQAAEVGAASIPMPKIFISLKKISAAANDLISVVKNRRIKQRIDERAAGHRTVCYETVARDEIWTALRKMPFDEVREARARLKRAAEENPDDEAAAKKLKKAEDRDAARQQDVMIDGDDF